MHDDELPVRHRCVEPGCSGGGFYSSYCHFYGHTVETIEFVPAEQLRGAVEALRTIALFNMREGVATNLPSAEARIAREWLEAHDHPGGE